MTDLVDALVALVDAYHRGAPDRELHDLHAAALEQIELEVERTFEPDDEKSLVAAA